MYTGEQANQMVADILANLGDQGRVSEILNDFVSDYTGTLTEHETLTNEKVQLTNLNENLRNVNNKMMTQFSDLSFLTKKEEEKAQEQEQIEKENKLSYDDLFDEKGELK